MKNNYFYKEGYLACLKHIFHELSKMHHDPKNFDRKVIDRVWEIAKKKEFEVRGSGVEPEK